MCRLLLSLTFSKYHGVLPKPAKAEKLIDSFGLIEQAVATALSGLIAKRPALHSVLEQDCSDPAKTQILSDINAVQVLEHYYSTWLQAVMEQYVLLAYPRIPSNSFRVRIVRGWHIAISP